MLVALLSAFLGGLILNLMPCVFPIISLKAFGLARQGGDPRQMRREGLAFLGGTLLAMLALAGTLIALRAGGQAVGWGFQLQSPLVVALLVLVLLGSALNLAGLFEFGLGLQRMGQTMDGKDGLLGAALTGALAVVVATPCAGPFMASAIGFALVQPPLAALAIFAALGAGVAAPFTALSFSPALARRLPKPGAWMTTLKHALAFPMLAAAAWLLWVLAQQTGSAGLALMLGCALLLAFSCWIYGMAQRRTMSGRPARALHSVAALGAVAIAALFAMPGGALQAPAALAPTQASAAPVSDKPVPWSPEAVAKAQAAGHAVFVDFSAEWCLTCKVNEKAVLSTAAFKSAIADTGTTYMMADSTNYDARIEQAMMQLGRSGLPLYLVYPAKGGDPVILPQVLDTKTATDALRKASGKKV
ncbi:protein-disulfide reductase DsbD family protein [Novosphingobium resinovorum]|uniref:Cytochrome C biogenesis protein n=1 Tax=Novosphingobium resinovorum TaxID=158500 RepID=A0A031JQE5_9SPHN|nr:thioredoxin family protein [Novosphingobium resinovorum]AOR79718.1 cytochrome C biogenesis protein [Novosphingobium resinovorum]EZP75636.1 Thio:disulfide interchange protein [Novosphingobium resinovorum]